MTYKAIDVANYVIGYANKLGQSVTNPKLQKILYFIQGYGYSKLNKQLIDADFEAWTYGPAIRNIYIEFSRFGSLLITDFYKSNYENIYFDNKDKIFLNNIIKELNKFSFTKLTAASMSKDSPRVKTYEKDKANIIDKASIEKFFKKL